MHPDQKYIDALVNNDEKLLEELYQKCFPVIKSMVLQNKGTVSNADDTFQDALVDLFRNAKAGKLILTSSICAYIKGICRNKWYDELHKQKRLGVTNSHFEEQYIGENGFNAAEAENVKHAQWKLIQQKFHLLGEKCKELLSLSWTKNEMGKNRTSDELAALLNVSNGYVRKKKSECIVKLIKLVTGDPQYKMLKQY